MSTAGARTSQSERWRNGTLRRLLVGAKRRTNESLTEHGRMPIEQKSVVTPTRITPGCSSTTRATCELLVGYATTLTRFIEQRTGNHTHPLIFQ